MAFLDVPSLFITNILCFFGSWLSWARLWKLQRWRGVYIGGYIGGALFYFPRLPSCNHSGLKWGGLDWMIHRDPFQPLHLRDSVIIFPFEVSGAIEWTENCREPAGQAWMNGKITWIVEASRCSAGWHGLTCRLCRLTQARVRCCSFAVSCSGRLLKSHTWAFHRLHLHEKSMCGAFRRALELACRGVRPEKLLSRRAPALQGLGTAEPSWGWRQLCGHLPVLGFCSWAGQKSCGFTSSSCPLLGLSRRRMAYAEEDR